MTLITLRPALFGPFSQIHVQFDTDQVYQSLTAQLADHLVHPFACKLYYADGEQIKHLVCTSYLWYQLTNGSLSGTDRTQAFQKLLTNGLLDHLMHQEVIAHLPPSQQTHEPQTDQQQQQSDQQKDQQTDQQKDEQKEEHKTACILEIKDAYVLGQVVQPPAVDCSREELQDYVCQMIICHAPFCSAYVTGGPKEYKPLDPNFVWLETADVCCYYALKNPDGPALVLPDALNIFQHRVQLVQIAPFEFVY